jgi:hypothetical protein
MVKWFMLDYRVRESNEFPSLDIASRDYQRWEMTGVHTVVPYAALVHIAMK